MWHTNGINMPIFAIPLAPNSALPNSRLHLSSVPSRKRKRAPPSPTSSEDEKLLSDHELPDASTNPLSLTPAEIAQYKLAGLALNKEIPGKERGFPHRALPEKALRGVRRREVHGEESSGAEEGFARKEGRNEDEEKKRERGPGLRSQHLSVLTAILHKCLLAGDIPRASRAWALLIRAEVGGHAVDIRGSGYWGIGAELLIRSTGASRNDQESGSIEEVGDISKESDGDVEPGSKMVGDEERRWGTREGLKRAKNYYERLILQYPYKRWFHDSVTALDFWPAMVGCEIYGIQWEQKDGLRKIAQREEQSDDSDGSSISEDSGTDDEGGGKEQSIRLRRRQRKEEQIWQEKESIRKNSLVESEEIARRLDGLMNTLPYSDSHAILRLRGMLALYIGDLSVPTRPIDADRGDDDEGRNGRLGIGGRETERRFLIRQRVIEHERGKKKQAEERERARELFSRIMKDGGDARVNLDDLTEDEASMSFMAQNHDIDAP